MRRNAFTGLAATLALQIIASNALAQKNDPDPATDETGQEEELFPDNSENTGVEAATGQNTGPNSTDATTGLGAAGATGPDTNTTTGDNNTGIVVPQAVIDPLPKSDTGEGTLSGTGLSSTAGAGVDAATGMSTGGGGAAQSALTPARPGSASVGAGSLTTPSSPGVTSPNITADPLNPAQPGSVQVGGGADPLLPPPAGGTAAGGAAGGIGGGGIGGAGAGGGGAGSAAGGAGAGGVGGGG